MKAIIAHGLESFELYVAALQLPLVRSVRVRVRR